MLSRRSAACGLCLSALAAAKVAAANRILLGAAIDVSRIAPGRWLDATLDGRSLCVRRRTPAEIQAARSADLSILADPEPDEVRACDPEWLIVELLCPHGGCRPLSGLGPYKGWLCPCHGSVFDLSGRVRRGPAKSNLRSRSYRLDGERLTVLAACPAPSSA